jgi:homoserine dehydrogenase
VKEIPLVLLGFGNVGQSLLRLLEENEGYRDEGVVLRVHSVFDRGGGVRVGTRPLEDLLAAKQERRTVTALEGAEVVPFDAALESAGRDAILVDTSVTDAVGGGPGLSPAERALDNGTSVVFASKGPLVVAYAELVRRAKQSGARIGASAAVGIPLPSLEVGVVGMRGAGLTRFRGVLNDTTNQILRDLESGISLEASIERARLAGTLEENPKLDLDGWDATYKLLILARAIWDPSLRLEAVATSGVSAIGRREIDEARSRRRRVRLIATGERTSDGGISLKTEPESLSAEDPLYSLAPGEKAVVFETRFMGTVTVKSSKGGPRATAACVVKDVLNIAAPPRPFA